MIEAWFPVPVYTTRIQGNDLATLQSELIDVFNKETFSKGSFWQRDEHSVTDPTFSGNLLDDHSCQIAHEQIAIHVKQYISGLGLDPNINFKIVSSWLTLTKEQEYARTHTHGGVDIAGTYWIKTNSNDGDLYFNTPNQLVRHSYICRNISAYNSVKPEVGKMVLWPGYLEHGVRFNETTNDRISLAFNILIDKVY